MTEEQMDRLVAKLDAEMIRANHCRTRPPRFEGVALIHPTPADNGATRALIAEHNHKARSYNATAGHLGRILQEAIDGGAPAVRPVEGGGLLDVFLGLLDEYLRSRAATRQPVLLDAAPQAQQLERRLWDLLHQRGGIHDLQRRIGPRRRHQR